MPKHTDRENPIQRSIIAYLRLVLPDCIIHHSPNEFGMSGADVARQIAKHKHNGMLPGWPDLHVIADGAQFFLEVKAEGNSLTPAQKSVHADLERHGQRVAVVRSIADVQERLDDWGIPTLMRYRGVIS